MADVAKQEQPVETTPAVDQKATPTPEKTVENSPPPADADKGKGEENSAKDEKTETAVVNGDAKVQEEDKKSRRTK